MKSTIVYPNEPSEAEIQFFVLYKLKGMGLDARAEARSRKKLKCRLDIVVFRKKQPLLIIECKKCKVKTVHPNYRKKVAKNNCAQKEKYESLGFPVDWVFGMKEAEEYISSFREKHDSIFNPIMDDWTYENAPLWNC